jgi:hypothetical protein
MIICYLCLNGQVNKVDDSWPSWSEIYMIVSWYYFSSFLFCQVVRDNKPFTLVVER